MKMPVSFARGLFEVKIREICLHTAANLLSRPPTPLSLSLSLVILPSRLSSSCVYSSSGWIHHQEGPLLREWPNLSDAGARIVDGSN